MQIIEICIMCMAICMEIDQCLPVISDSGTVYARYSTGVHLCTLHISIWKKNRQYLPRETCMYCAEGDDNSRIKMSKNIRFRQLCLSIRGELSILCT